MKAGIFQGLYKVSVEETEKPELIPGSVIIKNERSGICITDITAFTDDYESVFIFPGNQFGHEMVGVVDEVADGVTEKTGLKPGDRVFVNPCTFKEPTPEMCMDACCDMAGAFSEYIRVDDPQIDYNIHFLPEDLPWDSAVLIEPIGETLKGVLAAEPKSDDNILIYGGGIQGLGTLGCLKAMGYNNVIAAAGTDISLERIRQMGGIPCDTREISPVDFVKQQWGVLTGTMGEETWNVDVVFECSSAPKILEAFMSNAKCGSKFSQIAPGDDESSITASQIIYKEIQIKGTYAYTPDVIKKTVELVVKDPDAFVPMITDVFGLTELEKAMETASDPSRGIKVLIDHSR